LRAPAAWPPLAVERRVAAAAASFAFSARNPIMKMTCCRSSSERTAMMKKRVVVWSDPFFSHCVALMRSRLGSSVASSASVDSLASACCSWMRCVMSVTVLAQGMGMSAPVTASPSAPDGILPISTASCVKQSSLGFHSPRMVFMATKPFLLTALRTRAGHTMRVSAASAARRDLPARSRARRSVAVSSFFMMASRCLVRRRKRTVSAKQGCTKWKVMAVDTGRSAVGSWSVAVATAEPMSLARAADAAECASRRKPRATRRLHSAIMASRLMGKGNTSQSTAKSKATVKASATAEEREVALPVPAMTRSPAMVSASMPAATASASVRALWMLSLDDAPPDEAPAPPLPPAAAASAAASCPTMDTFVDDLTRAVDAAAASDDDEGARLAPMPEDAEAEAEAPPAAVSEACSMLTAPLAMSSTCSAPSASIRSLS
jgi:hypothetical protein